MTNLVIVTVDEDVDQSFALQRASNIATSFQAALKVVQFVPQASSDTDRQTASRRLKELVKDLFSAPDDVTSQVVSTDNVSEWIADHSPIGDDNLVVVSGHRNESLIHTPVDWRLIRQLNCPLLIGCDQKWKSNRNVLIALDLSSRAASHRDLNRRALHWARQWEAASDCQLHAMYCIPIPAPLLALDIVERHEYQRAHEPAAREKLIALLEEFGMPHVTPHILAGTPEKMIPHTANKLKADLVIIGSFGYGKIQRLLHHNTAEKVLHKLRTDMLVVKPTELPAASQ